MNEGNVSKASKGDAATAADLDKFVRDVWADKVVMPEEVPSIDTDPAVIEAGRLVNSISADLRKLEAELAAFVGEPDGADGPGKPGTIPKRYRNDPAAAAIHLEAARMVGDNTASGLLAKLDRYGEVRRQLPVVRKALELATSKAAEAHAAAERKLIPVGKAVFAPAIRSAVRAYLRALVEMTACAELYRRLLEARIGSGIHPPPFVAGQVPANARQGGGLCELLARLSHEHGITWDEVAEAAPELIAEGLIPPGYRAYFAG